MFVYDQAAGLDVSGPLEVFSAVNHLRAGQGKPAAYDIKISAPEAGSLTLSSGMQMQAPLRLGDNYSSDYFVVVGGFTSEQLSQDKDLVARIRRRAQRSACQVSVCTGAFILAAAGLLDRRSCTTHWRFTQKLAQDYPALKVDHDAIYVQSGSTYTSAGVTAGIDLALALVEQDFGAETAMEVARYLVLYLRRPGGQSQFSEPMALRQKAGQDFSELHDWLLEKLDTVLSVELMADHCHMSPRHFARRFVEVTGVSPARYLEQLRLTQARELLESSALSVEAIALQVGFAREERLRRVFLKNLGVTPSVYRQHFAYGQPA